MKGVLQLCKSAIYIYCFYAKKKTCSIPLSFLPTVSSNHQPADYSLALYSQIPIKYLLQQARKDQEHFRDLYPPLLRLLVTYYPHLCLVEDWIGEEDRAAPHSVTKSNSSAPVRLTNAAVTEGKRKECCAAPCEQCCAAPREQCCAARDEHLEHQYCYNLLTRFSNNNNK